MWSSWSPSGISSTRAVDAVWRIATKPASSSPTITAVTRSKASVATAVTTSTAASPRVDRTSAATLDTRTIWVAVAMTNARVSDTATVLPSGRPSAERGLRSRVASEGSAMKPTSSEVTVMPSCAPDSSVESFLRPAWSDCARLSPPAAARSTVGRSTVTKANSAATKSAFARMRSSASSRRSHASVTRGLPHGRGGRGQAPGGAGLLRAGARDYDRQAWRRV